MGVVVGLDGGGTKTHVLVADEHGEVLGAATSGPSNWEDVGLEATASTIRAVISEALGAAGVGLAAVSSSVFGLAGVDWPADVTRLSMIAETMGLAGEHELLNDAFVALRAGSNHPWGVCVIAGGGAVAVGRNPDGAEARTLGLGQEFGDFGSAPDLSQEGLRAVAESYVGFGPPTILAERYQQALAAPSVEAMLEQLSRGGPLQLGALSPVVVQAAEEGDAPARAIVERAGTSLGRAAGLVARKLHMEDSSFEVVLAGGVLRAGSRTLLGPLERELHRSAPSAVIVRLEVPPVVGAVLRALERLGQSPSGAIHLRLSLESMKHLRYEFG